MAMSKAQLQRLNAVRTENLVAARKSLKKKRDAAAKLGLKYKPVNKKAKKSKVKRKKKVKVTKTYTPLPEPVSRRTYVLDVPKRLREIGELIEFAFDAPSSEVEDALVNKAADQLSEIVDRIRVEAQ